MPFLYRISDTGDVLEGWRIGDETMIIGRGDNADLKVRDDRLSRLHFAISRADGGLTLCDLGSSNGTWVGGQRVTRHQLQPGDRIRAGRTFFVFEEGLTTAMAVLAGNRAGDTEALGC